MLLAVSQMSFFSKYPTNSNVSLEEINAFFAEIEKQLNNLFDSINKEGEVMNNFKLKTINSYEELVPIYNQNVNTLKNIFISLEQRIPNIIFNKTDLLANRIKFINDTMNGDIKINNENIEIQWKDGSNNESNLVIDANGVNNG